VLAVAVDSPAWATQLRLLGNELLGRLSEAAGSGVVTALDVRVRP
jgi:predicted nucleic acid-binding Zn ribbon protein